MRACLVAIGSELLRPGFRETHSGWITPHLESTVSDTNNSSSSPSLRSPPGEERGGRRVLLGRGAE